MISSLPKQANLPLSYNHPSVTLQPTLSQFQSALSTARQNSRPPLLNSRERHPPAGGARRTCQIVRSPAPPAPPRPTKVRAANVRTPYRSLRHWLETAKLQQETGFLRGLLRDLRSDWSVGRAIRPGTRSMSISRV